MKPFDPERLKRERETIRAMIGIYCRGHHAPADGLCPDCSDLLAYAEQRIDQCPFQADKTSCAQCTVHCYQPERREQVRRVMRYSGPRMLVHHPILALRHSLDGKKALARRQPKKPGKT